MLHNMETPTELPWKWSKGKWYIWRICSHVHSSIFRTWSTRRSQLFQINKIKLTQLTTKNHFFFHCYQYTDTNFGLVWLNVILFNGQHSNVFKRLWCTLLLCVCLVLCQPHSLFFSLSLLSLAHCQLIW